MLWALQRHSAGAGLCGCAVEINQFGCIASVARWDAKMYQQCEI